ncbi:hypothetical protein [uncultured Photobacterium sp.]|uniref:hypothetical protein n=1 Tax=uncultured Photobacterium sp. TaxID=173973 RepID=UPI00261211B0|nr:hypothetical protein [uncultured Photobacterium sp.]
MSPQSDETNAAADQAGYWEKPDCAAQWSERIPSAGVTHDLLGKIAEYSASMNNLTLPKQKTNLSQRQSIT